MYIVLDGRLGYFFNIVESQNVSCGQWASEASLFTPWIHRGVLKAQTECRLLTVDAQRAVDHLITHRTSQGYAHKYAMKYVEELNKAPLNAITDIGGPNDGGPARAEALRI